MVIVESNTSEILNILLLREVNAIKHGRDLKTK